MKKVTMSFMQSYQAFGELIAVIMGNRLHEFFKPLAKPWMYL